MDAVLALHRILVPIDFTATSLNALQTAIAMAIRHKAELILVHIVSTEMVYVLPEGGIMMDTGIDASVKTALLQLDDMARRIRQQHNLTCAYEVKSGSVTFAVVETAKKRGVDIIVMGAYETSKLWAFFMGSTAFSILKNAPCPVLTVPSRKQWLRFKSVLFPVRPVVNALEKYEFARKIIQKNDAKLIVMGVLERLGPHNFDELNKEASQLINNLKTDGVQLQTEFHFCDSLAEIILEKAHLLDVDLLIITASIDYQIKNSFIGPFAQQIVNHANVPVLSIRPSGSFFTQKPLGASTAFLDHLHQATSRLGFPNSFVN
ncbi:universal stress protein [Runella aurantiaca]|uniref:Universal stress protein n=1 Tax=Runella aurantiaca TaxID=2282308 RepID=A0A369IAP3_9BACT|nr:universal stress protein [Runella aurantiaca]RDB06708.1 universal stress protein [Runella aurantiaca]